MLKELFLKGKIWRVILHLPSFIKLFFRLLIDQRVPVFPKLIVLGAVAYILSPFDVLPDFLLPFLGYLEDLIIFFLSLYLLVRLSPKEVVREKVEEIDKEMRGRGRYTYYGRGF
jgi:uncharacterized membrane protein YkvA (DUF1232 family)